jgi:hypothetical protein
LLSHYSVAEPKTVGTDVPAACNPDMGTGIVDFSGTRRMLCSDEGQDDTAVLIEYQHL